MFANLSKPQAEVLAGVSFGIDKAKSCALNAIVRIRIYRIVGIYRISLSPNSRFSP